MPELNPDSDASCELVEISDETITDDETQRYRTVTITQDQGDTCILDYFGRLAVGSHLFPGASLHANLYNQNLAPGGVGNKERSIPVNEITPQSISKDMTAVQGSNHTWNVTKSSSPETIPFGDTCDPSTDLSIPLTVTVTWTRNPADPNGPITITTNVYATNPASRAVTINVTDQIRSGTTVLDTANSGPVVLPANETDVLVINGHQFVAPAGTTNINDIATGSYTDTFTGIPIPQTTTATANAVVVPSQNPSNASAVITDTESITGPFTFSADSFSFSANSPLGMTGSFNAPYVAGTPTSGPVGWTSSSANGSGAVTFSKTVYVPAGTSRHRCAERHGHGDGLERLRHQLRSAQRESERVEDGEPDHQPDDSEPRWRAVRHGLQLRPGRRRTEEDRRRRQQSRSPPVRPAISSHRPRARNPVS